MTITGWWSIDLCGAAHVAAGHGNRFGQIVGALPAHRGGDVRVLRARGDNATDVRATVLAPVPHIKRVRAVVRVAAAVHLYVARIRRELALVLLAQRVGVARFGQEPVEELDVARMLLVVELVVAGVVEYEHAAF